MAKFKLLEKAYCKQHPGAAIEQIWDEGTEIETKDDAIPGPHMEPLDEAARKAMAKYLKDGAPLDARKVAALNAGVPTIGGGVLPGVGDAGDAGAMMRLMQQLMDQQAQQQKALIEALNRLAA